jgi:hypothetical protein
MKAARTVSDRFGIAREISRRAERLAGSPPPNYDNGVRPSVAVSGTNVIEVHQGTANGLGPLWYKTGQIQPNGSVRWANTAFQYDNGGRPSVAISGLNVIEVHQGTASGFGPLWYKTGQIQPDGGVKWSSTAFQYDYGGAPRVAAAGPNVVEVHQGAANGFGPLWYKTGQILPGGDVVWNATAFYYDSGVAPSVSLVGATILEAHQGADGFGSLWYKAGQIQPGGTVAWNFTGFQYDYGVGPSIALTGAVALEVHQGGTSFGFEWYRTFSY